MTQWNDMDDDSSGNGVKEWFIVHTYSGFEKKVMDSLRQRAEVEGIVDEEVGVELFEADLPVAVGDKGVLELDLRM